MRPAQSQPLVRALRAAHVRSSGSAVAGPSRCPAQTSSIGPFTADRAIASSSRQAQQVQTQRKSRSSHPEASEGSSSRSKVAYAQDKNYASSERRSFFQDGTVLQGSSGGLGEREVPPELVPGRVVECRR